MSWFKSLRQKSSEKKPEKPVFEDRLRPVNPRPPHHGWVNPLSRGGQPCDRYVRLPSQQIPRKPVAGSMGPPKTHEIHGGFNFGFGNEGKRSQGLSRQPAVKRKPVNRSWVKRRNHPFPPKLDSIHRYWCVHISSLLYLECRILYHICRLLSCMFMMEYVLRTAHESQTPSKHTIVEYSTWEREAIQSWIRSCNPTLRARKRRITQNSLVCD